MLSSGRNEDIPVVYDSGGRRSTGLVDSSDPFGNTVPALAGPGPGPGSGPVHLGSLVRYKWSILAVFLSIAVPAVTVIWAVTVPKYAARGEVRVRPIIPHLVFKTEDSGPIQFYHPYLNTQVAVIRSPAVLDRVLDDDEVRKTAWYAERRRSRLIGRKLSRMDRLKDDLVVKPRAKTEIIDVTMTARNPKDAKVIANVVLREYLAYVEGRSDDQKTKIYQQLLDRRDMLRNEIGGLEKVTANLRRDLGTGMPEELVSRRRLRLDDMESQLADLGRQIAMASWEQDQLKKLMDAKPGQASGSVPSTASRYREDAEWRKLYMDVAAVKQMLTLESGQLGPNHPRMITLRRQLKLAEQQLRVREGDLARAGQSRGGSAALAGATGTGLVKELGVLAMQIERLKYQKKLLLKDMESENTDFRQTFESAQLLEKENEAIRHKRELYTAVRSRVDQKQMERNVPGSIEILARAYAPTKPAQDRRLITTLMVLFAAGGTGVAQAFLRATMSRTIHEVEQLDPAGQVPFLGQLPLVRDASYVDLMDCPIQNEYVRMVRTSLLERLRGRSGAAVVVTSAEPGAGKTTVAMMLARSLAQCGKKVLLVDADFRNPAVSQRFEIADRPGLQEVLASKLSDAEGIVDTDVPRLSVLPAGTQHEQAELISNGVFQACLDRWRGVYEIILLDSPPVLPVADARILSGRADGTIMVVREGSCRRDELVDALAYLGTSGGTLFGTVFVGSRKRSSYGRGRYHYYYGQTPPKQIDRD